MLRGSGAVGACPPSELVLATILVPLVLPFLVLPLLRFPLDTFLSALFKALL